MIREIVAGAKSLLFPQLCLGCRLPLTEALLCPKCLKGLPFSGVPLRRVPGRRLDLWVSPFLYEGVIKELILEMKYRGQLSLARPGAGWMTAAVQGAAEELSPEWIVPVPLHPARLRERTFNQAQALAQPLAQALKLPCRGDVLERRKPTPPQTGLSRLERLENVRGAFSLRPGAVVQASSVLLVDDVFTTGATLEACAQVLKKTGVSRVAAVTLARG
ncbi:MAG: ComF family protein [Candidatus Omnitrophica bacterium]|nr:ComF family protein [Candidatus Omnitrophota bacterium]